MCNGLFCGNSSCSNIACILLIMCLCGCCNNGCGCGNCGNNCGSCGTC